MNQTIYSERLILRKFEESDINDIYKIFSDKDTNRFLPWFPLEKLSDVRLFYKERCAEVYRTDSGYAYAVCLKEDNVPIGYVNVSLDESHDLGYGLLPQFRGMGIMSEAVGAVLNRLKSGWFAIHYRHPRRKQSSQRRSYEEGGYDLPVFIP